MLAVAKKDLVEQGWVLLLGGAVSLTVLVGLLTRAGGQPDSLLQAFRTFVLVALTPLALLAARRLIVRELARGLDLLERLPIRLGLLVPLKAFIAAAPLAAGAALGSAITVQAIGLFSPNVPDDLEGRLVRGAAAWLVLVHGLTTLSATLGRRRATVVAAAALGLGLAARLGLVDVAALPPVRLVRAGFLVALDDPAADADLKLTAGAGLAALVVACLVGAVLRGRLLRGGAGPWRARDVVPACVLLAAAVAVWASLALASARAPAELEGHVARSGAVVVRVTAPDLEARTLALSATLDAALARQAALLGRPAREVALEAGPQPDLWSVTRAPAGRRAGLQLRADVGAPDLDQPLLVAAVLAATLDDGEGAEVTGGWRALLDGLPLWIAAGSQRLPARAELLAAWAVAVTGPEAVARLEGWDALRARVGLPAARAAAAWLLGQVAIRNGPDAVEALAREAAHPGRSFEAALAALPRGGADPERLATALATAARALVTAQATALAALPGGGAAEAWLEPARDDGARAVGFSATPARGAGLVVLHHAALAPGAALPPPHAAHDLALAGGPAARTEARYGAGARVAVAVTVPAPEVGTDLPLDGWRVLDAAATRGGP